MRIHRIGAAVAAAAFALTAAACGGGSDAGGGGGGEADQPYVAIVSKGFQHQFWQAVKQGAEQEAARQGVRISFEGPATEADIEAQVTMLTNALGRQPDVIGFAALDSRAAAPLLQQAQSRDIPVIAFDSGVDSDIPLTTAATDNKAAAAEAAKHMAEALGGTGKVALVVHDQTSKSGTDRRDGFTEWMQANAPGIQLLEPQYGGGDQAKSADITKAIIAANPDLKGIYGSNEGSAIGVVRGVQESGVQGLTIVGFDSGAAQVEAIRGGTMLGAITQNPIGMGEQLVDAAVKATRGEQLPPVIDTGFFWYDQSNIDSPEIQEVLYQ
jgi:ribose transport system substrate-binding protein